MRAIVMAIEPMHEPAKDVSAADFRLPDSAVYEIARQRRAKHPDDEREVQWRRVRRPKRDDERKANERHKRKIRHDECRHERDARIKGGGEIVLRATPIQRNIQRKAC